MSATSESSTKFPRTITPNPLSPATVAGPVPAFEALPGSNAPASACAIPLSFSEAASPQVDPYRPRSLDDVCLEKATNLSPLMPPAPEEYRTFGYLASRNLTLYLNEAAEDGNEDYL